MHQDRHILAGGQQRLGIVRPGHRSHRLRVAARVRRRPQQELLSGVDIGNKNRLNRSWANLRCPCPCPSQMITLRSLRAKQKKKGPGALQREAQRTSEAHESSIRRQAAWHQPSHARAVVSVVASHPHPSSLRMRFPLAESIKLTNPSCAPAAMMRPQGL